jgi:alkylation response protein AidB-like acyl-CoA dehydrogenase
MSTHFYRDNEDLRFYMEQGIDWAPLVALVEQDYRFGVGPGAEGPRNLEEALESYRDMLETVGGFAATRVAPHAARIDREGVVYADGEVQFPPTLAKVFDEINGLGLHGMSLPRELGGSNCPLLLYFLNSELFARADVSVMSHHGFHGGMAMALLFFSISEGSTTWDRATGRITATRWAEPIREIAEGRAWGCMDITEPNAGSDMAALRTQARQDPDGQWRLTGEKVFITSGHGKYHFVVARSETGATADGPFGGLEGLSMFMVPMWADTPTGRRRLGFVDRVEEKLGHHGSATAAVRFDDTPADLVGRRGEGFQQMLLLMNNARLGVAFEALGLCEASTRLARTYAEQRPSMGKMIARHELIADALDEMEVDTQAIRALAVTGAYAEELSQRLRVQLAFAVDAGSEEAKTLERRMKQARARARRLTPLSKYLASERGVELARRCVQLHGGVGYTKEYGAEKLLRDALVMPIYEGTSQIQALMAMKDTLGGIIKDPAGFARRVGHAQWAAVSARDPLERAVARLQQRSLAAQRHLMTRTASAKLRATPFAEWSTVLRRAWDPKRDFALAMLHAERLTRLLCDEAVAEILLEQAGRFEARRPLLERFIERAELRSQALHAEITTTGDRLLRSLAG